MALRDSRYGKFYGCTDYPNCQASHGAHADGSPLGIPADGKTKNARMRAHEEFDKLWKSGRMRRTDSYRWMQRTLGLSAAEAHIGRFNEEMCEMLIQAVRTFLRQEP